MEIILALACLVLLGAIVLLAWLTDLVHKYNDKDFYGDWYDDDEGL